MQKRKQFLQKHRMRAFAATLEQIESRLNNRLQFINDYAAVYKFPKALTRRNTKELKKWLKAANDLKEIQHKDIT